MQDPQAFRASNINFIGSAFSLHFAISDVRTRMPYEPSKTSRRPAWIVRVRSSDPLYHDAPRQRDVRARPVRETRRRVDENRLA